MLSKKKMMLIVIIAIVVVLFGVLGIWRIVLSHQNPPLHATRVTIGNAVFSAEAASTIIEQARGLSGRAGLGQGEGMIFFFNSPGVQNFWMKDMNFPIDMIWIGGTPAKVLGFAENVTPEPGAPLWNLKIYSSPRGVDTVLEVKAGTVAKEGIKAGDLVSVSERKGAL